MFVCAVCILDAVCFLALARFADDDVVVTAADACARPSIMRLLRKYTGNNEAHSPPDVGIP